MLFSVYERDKFIVCREEPRKEGEFEEEETIECLSYKRLKGVRPRMQEDNYFNDRLFTLRQQEEKYKYESRYINLKDVEFFLEVPVTSG